VLCEFIPTSPLGQEQARASADCVEDRCAVKPESKLETAELMATIAALPDDFRKALVAIDMVGLSYREAA
jgi:DNA-directed RNA polymerase specialized sigma24 family protein